jgi:hypothetical protein
LSVLEEPQVSPRALIVKESAKPPQVKVMVSALKGLFALSLCQSLSLTLHWSDFLTI